MSDFTMPTVIFSKADEAAREEIATYLEVRASAFETSAMFSKKERTRCRTIANQLRVEAHIIRTGRL